MSIWKRLLGSAGAKADDSQHWKEFGQRVRLHEYALASLIAAAKLWPDSLHPGQFAAADWLELVKRVRAYIDMPYPMADMRAKGNAPGRTYRISDDGHITREGNAYLDMLIYQCRPTYLNQGLLGLNDIASGQHPGALGTWRLIEHYSNWPLARFVFSLSAISDEHDMATRTGKAVIVPEHRLVQIYRGVENTLVEVYEHLPEGGRISDKAVTLKLQALIRDSA